MRNICHLAAVSFFVLTLAGCASAPPTPPAAVARGDYAAVQRYGGELIQHVLDARKVQGISIALVDDQKLVWSQGFGFADAQARRPATGNTVYRVGSLSKLFTDVAALQLVESGQLQLDAPVQSVLPGFRPKTWDNTSANITPRMLMTHHSGLQRDVVQGFHSPTPQRFGQLVSGFDSYLAYQPGQLLSYSNIGLSVLGAVVEQQSGMPFEARLQQSVLAPLGMTHSAFSTAAAASPDMAQSYDARGVKAAVPLRDVPAGGLNSSANDLSRFMQAIFADGKTTGQPWLKPETLAAMFTPQNTAVKLDLGNAVGLGWFLQLPAESTIPGGGLLAAHGGAIDGHRSQIMLLPQHKLGVVVLANTSTGIGAVNHIATEVLKLALEANTGERAPTPSNRVAQRLDRPLTADEVAQWVGDYTTPMGHVRVLADKDNALKLEVFGRTAELHPRDDGLFGVRYKWLGLFPVSLGDMGSMGLQRDTVDGHEVLIAHNGKHTALGGERVRAAPLDANLRVAVSQYLGEYAPADEEAKAFVQSVRVFEERGLLLAEVKSTESNQAARTVLKPITARLALALGPLADRGEAVEIIAGETGAVEVRAMGLRLKKLDGTGH